MSGLVASRILSLWLAIALTMTPLLLVGGFNALVADDADTETEVEQTRWMLKEKFQEIEGPELDVTQFDDSEREASEQDDQAVENDD